MNKILITALITISILMIFDINKQKIISLLYKKPLRSSNGKEPTGTEFPENINDLELPISILVKPGKVLDCGLVGGDMVQLQYIGGENFKFTGYINGQLGEYIITYSEIKQKTFKPLTTNG